MRHSYESQAPYTCKLDWGKQGSARAASRGDIVVLVDTLSFSTTTIYAVSRGARIYPCAKFDNALNLAEAVGAKVAVRRHEVPARGRYSLSPSTFDGIAGGEGVVLPSRNGGTCCKCIEGAQYVIAGALVNASAVAAVVSRLIATSHRDVTVIACGEREKGPESRADLRVAIEDYLGAGAIIAGIERNKSPEARVCEAAYLGSADKLTELLWDSISGRELRAKGFGDDVIFAARKDEIPVVPVLRAGAFGLFSG